MIKDLMTSGDNKEKLLMQIQHYKSWDLSLRQICDLELLLNGGFSPLGGFLNQDDYESVVNHMRTVNGVLWPIPITLDVSQAFAEEISVGENIVLRDFEGVALAVLQVESKYKPDKRYEAICVFGADDVCHPAVSYLYNQANDWYLGGKLQGLTLPQYYDYTQYRYTPNELRRVFVRLGINKVVAFQTRNPMHRAHFELTRRAMDDTGAHLLLQPTVGMTKPGDIDHYTRVRCYEHIMNKYPDKRATLSLLPLAMRMAGPREALLHAIIRKNYGATHFIVGRDHAGPGNNINGLPFYDPYMARDLASKHAVEIGIDIVPFDSISYAENRNKYLISSEIKPDDNILDISGTEFRRRLLSDLPIPTWFSFPEVIEVLKKRHPPKSKSGFTVFFTGLSGSGKSTIANALLTHLMQYDRSQITLLDGDIVRRNLSSELGFSKEHRDLNILRIGYVASEITKHRGIAICAPIAPYEAVRQMVRSNIQMHGGFIEVYLSTSIELCEKRDRKGLYRKARLGLIKNFTGIDDPYEIPKSPELILDTEKLSIKESVSAIIDKIISLGYLK